MFSVRANERAFSNERSDVLTPNTCLPCESFSTTGLRWTQGFWARGAGAGARKAAIRTAAANAYQAGRRRDEGAIVDLLNRVWTEGPFHSLPLLATLEMRKY